MAEHPNRDGKTVNASPSFDPSRVPGSAENRFRDEGIDIRKVDPSLAEGTPAAKPQHPDLERQADVAPDSPVNDQSH